MPHEAGATKKRILIVAVEQQGFDRIDPLLHRSYFVVERVPRGASGAMLCSNVPFDLVVAGHPLPDMPLADFVKAVRKAGSACIQTPLLVLAERSRLAEVEGPLRQGPCVALPVEEPQRLVDELANHLLGVASRQSTRVLVRIEVQVSEGKRLVMHQSENVSDGGMLLRTDRVYPLGTRMAFECLLPGDRGGPVRGEAEVVRHTLPELEKFTGVGMRFVSFKGDGQKRLAEFVAAQARAS